MKAKILNHEITVTVSVKKVEKRMPADEAYISLSNLYLYVERGQTPMSITIKNRLWELVGLAYETGDFMQDWWGVEFQKLPHWFEF